MTIYCKLVIAVALCVSFIIGPAWSEEDPAVKIVSPEPGSVSKEEGLEAWARVYEVASHPRCANCHVGDSPYPMWSGPSYGKTRRHGMNISAGTSRIGAETLQCSTCHTTSTSKVDNEVKHAAPRVSIPWLLAPAAADWFGQTSNTICEQLKDPERNGNRTIEELAEHLGHDVILHWAWEPGGSREPAPYSLQLHINDLLAWGAAGVPCPDE